jgi:hypothetical protein
MTDVNVPHRVSGVGRLGKVAAWISAVGCMPYLVLKVVWTIGMPVGITDQSELDTSGWVAGNALMAVIQLLGLLLVLALTQTWARRLPAYLLLVPAWVGTGLLFQVVVGAGLIGLFSSPSQDTSVSTGSFEPWVFVMVYSGFGVQGAALAIAFACYVQARWGWLLGGRTDEVLARGTAPDRSWLEDHFAGIAKVVAAMAVAIAIIFGYWAAGGSFGLPGSQPHPSWALQASRGAGALVAAVGLLGLASRWGHAIRFRLPAALLWIGSGALAAFDGLTLTLNRLFLSLGADAAEPAWDVADTVLVIKVAIGVLTAAVGALAVRAATKHVRRESAVVER